MKIKIYPEICCELCNDIIHNHLDCPSCNTKFSPSDNYGELELNDILVCGKCNAKFKILEKVYYDEDCEVEWINKP